MSNTNSVITDTTQQSMREKINGFPAYFQESHQRDELLKHWKRGDLFTREEVEGLKKRLAVYEKELEAANNEFGSQTANWEGLSTRIAELKKQANKPYQDGFTEGIAAWSKWVEQELVEAEEKGRKKGLEEATRLIEEAKVSPHYQKRNK